jgi:hypothetical protein
VGLAFLAILPKGMLDWLPGVWDTGPHVKDAIFQVVDLHLDRIALLVGRQGIDDQLSPTGRLSGVIQVLDNVEHHLVLAWVSVVSPAGGFAGKGMFFLIKGSTVTWPVRNTCCPD